MFETAESVFGDQIGIARYFLISFTYHTTLRLTIYPIWGCHIPTGFSWKKIELMYGIQNLKCMYDIDPKSLSIHEQLKWKHITQKKCQKKFFSSLPGENPEIPATRCRKNSTEIK